jgi:hypothetical protein
MSSFPTLNQVRSYKNYGLIFQGNTYDPIFTKGWLNSSPSISIQGVTCYLDYSQSFDTSDRTYLNRTFGSFSGGETFYIQPTKYYDPITELNTTLGGTCYFKNTLNSGKIIVSTVSSGMTFDSTYNFYKKENFLSPPQYTFGLSGSTGNKFLLNSFPQASYTSFKKMGFLGSQFGFQEYIDVSGATGSNTGRLTVIGNATLKDNQEILYISNGITSQSLLSTSSDVKMYIRGYSTVSQIQQPENIIGIYRIHDSDNKLVECYENQNYYQTYLRNQAIGSTYSGYWVQCESCPDNIYSTNISSDGIPSSLLFDNNIFLTIDQVSSVFSSTLSPSLVYTVFTQRNYSGTAQNASRLTFTINVGLKIDLSHSSLQGWSFQVFIDPSYTIPLINNIYISGQPGYDQSYILIKNAVDLPRTLYCQFNGPQTIKMVINV